MKTRKLGALEVSEIGFGTMSFASTYGASPEEHEAIRVIRGAHERGVTFFDTAEAYGWVGTGQLIGAALGSALAGFLIDSNGPPGAVWAATGLAFLGVLVPTVFRRWHPDLRGRDASPIPDTEPVPLTPS